MERIKTKKELNKKLKELRETLRWMQKKADELPLDELDSTYFEDLMCLSAELYYQMEGE